MQVHLYPVCIQKSLKPLRHELVLPELKKQVEHHMAETYNSCLLNLYHNGSEYSKQSPNNPYATQSPKIISPDYRY